MFWIIGVTVLIYIAVKILYKHPDKSTPSQPLPPQSHHYSKMFWGGWSRDIHYLYEQRDIAEKWNEINPDNFNTDTNSQTGTFGKFRVSLVSCTCKQFLSRRLPCKHMYYLADDLGNR